ncbi:MAG: hypothetical protein RLY20_980 [Verrucomicrobiota bacterium]|jgi:hypothetical protein
MATVTMTELNGDKPPLLDAKPAPLPAPRSPLYARLMNVIAMPGAVFEEVRTSRHAVGNWLLTLPLYAISLALFAAVIFSTPTVQKLFEENRPVWRKAQLDQLTEQVKAKKIQQTDVDETMKMFDTVMKPSVARKLVAVAGLGFGAVRPFWWTLVLWFLARAALRTRVSFGKALDVVGLATVVAILGNLATVALTVDFRRWFTEHDFAMAVGDLGGSGNELLVALLQNGLNFWFIAVLGTGLARLTQQPWFRGAFLVASYWIATDLFMLALGAGVTR